jgi:type IX secretion system PorP/SprF family membrane protein
MMKIRIKTGILFLLFLLSGWASGQQFPLTSHYTFNGYALDPGFAGLFSGGEATINYRKDWATFNGSPNTVRARGFGSLNDKMLLGGEIMNDRTDIFSRFKARVNYTYSLQMTDIQYLNFSVWTSLYQSTVYTSGVNGDPDDPLLKDRNKLSSTDFNAGFSLIYNIRYLTIGFGMPTLFRTKDAYLNQASGNFAFDQEMVFHVSDRFRLDPYWQIQPFFVWSRTNNMPSVIDLSATVIYQEKYWITMLYRNSPMLSLGVGGELYDGLSLAYSFEFGLGKVNNRVGNAHEITLSYCFDNKEKGKSGYLRKSGHNQPKPTEFEYRTK